MRAAWGAHTATDDDPPPSTAMCLAAATDNLAAGRDLLHTHFTTDQFGWRHGTSPGLRPSRPAKSTEHWSAK
jgi:hypothetical protein